MIDTFPPLRLGAAAFACEDTDYACGLWQRGREARGGARPSGAPGPGRRRKTVGRGPLRRMAATGRAAEGLARARRGWEGEGAGGWPGNGSVGGTGEGG